MIAIRYFSFIFWFALLFKPSNSGLKLTFELFIRLSQTIKKIF